MGLPYYKLDPLEHHIRLLRLLPGAGEDPLSAGLEIVSLDNNPQYTALSYVWGDPNIRDTIWLNEKETSITKNLAVALREFRDETSDQVMWVDALCINQNDDVEKGHQVRYMGEIYSKASLTWIWLGTLSDSENSELALNLISGLGDPSFGPFLTPVDDTSVSAVEKFLQRPWWKRVWIIQESVLSFKAVFRCGPREVPLETFMGFYFHLSGEYLDDHPQLNRLEPSDIPFAFAMDIPLRRGLTGGHSRRSFELGQLLFRTHTSRSTLPRDKIYALLGLCCPQHRAAIDVDYQISDREVFKKIAAWCLQTYDLSALSHLWLDGDRQLDLPTWVTDWSVPGSGYDVFWPSLAPLDSKWVWLPKGSFHISNDLETLRLKGATLDMVAYASSLAGHDVSYASSDTKALLTLVDYLECNPYGNKDRLLQAFWKVMASNWVWYSEEEPDANMMKCLIDISRNIQDSTFEARITALFRETPIWTQFQHMVEYVIYNRTFVITQNGYVGHAPRRAQPGDLVTRIRGSAFPLILRTLEAPLPTRQGNGVRYVYVGPAYVHKILEQGDRVGEDAGHFIIC